jgi:hypothetical protein
MKKILLATLLATTLVAQAADFVSVDVDYVKDTGTGQVSTAQYIRAGKEIDGLQLGLQGRTSYFKDDSGMLSSVDFTVGKNMNGLTPYVGVGYDNGFNGKTQRTYGIVGANYGFVAGPGFVLTGVKTRALWDSEVKKQSVLFGTYMLPVTKAVSVNLNVGRSYQDIKEDSYGLGLTVKF